MIGIDWGTSSFRAYRLRGAEILERRESPAGITTIEPGGFPAALRAAVGDWLADGESRVLLAGMVGSRQGWVEAPYLPCPAGTAQIVAALTPVPFEGAQLAIIPGLSHRDPAGVPEVMRGEETQLVGLNQPHALVCLPGTHSKWANVADGAITGFTTFMTGEVFAALRGHTILGRTMVDGAADDEAFRAGLARAGTPGGLLHHLFGVRTLGLFGDLPPTAASSYLSGLLIGHELDSVRPEAPVHLIGASSLCRLYALALAQRGLQIVNEPPDAAAAGLALVAEYAGWN